MDGISAIPQQPQLGRLAQFLRYLETQNAPEFLPRQLDVMGLVRQLALPQASTVENLSYGNLPFTMAPEGTGSLIPQVKTGRKPEVADLLGMISGVPGARSVMDVGTNLSNKAADALVRAITRNPQATAPGVIQETAMPFMQAVAPKAPGLLEAPRSELGFYSALEQSTIPLQNKGTGTQYLAQIEKTAGVKPEEIKWTGLDDFLKNRESVTKQEVQDFLAQNRVDVREVQLGTLTPEQSELRNQSLNRYRMLTNEIATARMMADEGTMSAEDARRFIGRRTAERDQLDQTINSLNTSITTKFSSYTLPGGENYREILLTLPPKPISTAMPDTSKWSVVTKETSPISGARQIQVRDENGNMIGQRFGFQGTDQDAIQELVPGYMARQQQISANQTNYRSSHFDQPNILAHMRVNDRVVDGKKTLFIEEIQSDWHQAGRKKGYGPQTETTVEAYYETKSGQRIPIGFGKTKAEAEASIDVGWKDTVDVKYETIERKVSEGVPDAPFKTTWHELALKRAIQEASEKKYDRIAFTTGKTQAARYDLSKQVNKIDVEAVNDVPNLYFVDVDVVGGKKLNLEVENGLVRNEEFAGKPLEDVVGKEIAERVFSIKQGNSTRLEGDDLRIGGEGMKGFYDNILPKSLDKLGKKFDAKVGKTEMDGVEVWAMDINPKMRESVLTKGQPLFAAPLLPAGLLDREE